MREPMPVQAVVREQLGGRPPDLATITVLVREGLEHLEHDPGAARLCLAAAERLLMPRDPFPAGGLLAWQIKRVGRYLDHQLDDRITLKAVAEQVRLSPSYFSRCFRRSFGAPFAKFVMQKRIERAQQLMVTSPMSLGQIALACGFADQAHFTRAFTNLTGGAPGKWRRQITDRDLQPPPRRTAALVSGH
ncbi:helix-turn-helix transcriptional regulator [Caulobacter endophyticus]|uniref:helix-turn-helix transcriptional regulator n=1 Tax=Caulobacter endophyticus TaxID=2172652 RepID=UPI0024105388|nr:AraC family transcriptional regulator [Caulobacter endophyticus]MDG2527937.1 AraC family transcriptional regulator [Caulobacter endophyticus]